MAREGAVGPPEPPAPLRPLEWSEGRPETWTSTGPTGTKWRIQRTQDGRYAITAGTWTTPDWWADSVEAAKAFVDTFEARHDDPMPAALGRAWAEVEESRDALCAEVEARVAEWAWGPLGARWERLEPLWHESYGERPKTRRLRQAPTRKSDAELFGFDATGRVVIARQFGDGFGNDDVVRRETLRVPGGDDGPLLVFSTEGARGTYRRWLSQLHVPTRDAAGRLIRLDVWFSERDVVEGFRWWGQAYGYDGDRLLRMWESSRAAPRTGWVHHRIGDRLAKLEVEQRGELRMTYDDAGRLLTITSGDDDAGRVIYRRTASGAVPKARRLIQQALPERIAAWAGRTAPDAEVYCLAIQYAEHYNRPLPPALGLGTIAELEEWKRRHSGTGLASVMWNPAEFAHFDVEPAELLNDTDLRDAYQVLNQEWVSTDDDRQPRQLLVAAAKALAARDLPKLRVGPRGLAVYAVDLELEDLERNLEASVPKATLRRLAAGAATCED